MNFSIVMSSAFFFFFFFALSTFLLLKGVGESVVLVLEWEFSEKLFMELSFPVVVDLVSCLFMMTVFFISGSVLLFTGFYLAHENFMKRFIGILSLFVLSMVLLILFPNYVSLMVGWDGLGVVSFLLVVYYMNSGSLSAGMITAISNRVGDVFFILVIGMMGCCMSFGMSSTSVWGFSVMGLLVLLGSITKSAQIPFSAWLPEAMAAPTPVSTLVHSSTLVTAGVYVLIRFSSLLGSTSYYLLLLLSMMTVIMAGMSGVLEVDMKKVVALSTLSQVGMMMFAIAMGATKVAFFHLTVHAFFKALMFLCVGGVIFYSGGVQDGRFLGGLWLKMPFTCMLLLFSNLSLMGFPFMSGFYSKELILGMYLLGNCSLVGFLFLFLSLVLTFSYSIRMMMLMMSYSEVAPLEHYKMSNNYYVLSLVLMGNGAVGAGLMMQLMVKDLVFFSNMNPSVFYGWLVLSMLTFLNLVVLVGMKYMGIPKKLLKEMVSKMWFLKSVSGNLISSSSLISFCWMTSYVEMGWIRGFLWSGGLKESVYSFGKSARKLNFNMIGLVMSMCLCLWVVMLL